MSTIAPISGPRSVRAAADIVTASAAAGAARTGATETRFVGGGGPRKAGSMSIKERFDTLEQRFLPEKAKGVDVRLQFNLSGAGGGQWYVEIKDGKIKVKTGTGPNPSATLSASAADYKKIADGEMNKMVAFLRGKLKVKGDRKALEPFDTWFKKP